MIENEALSADGTAIRDAERIRSGTCTLERTQRIPLRPRKTVKEVRLDGHVMAKELNLVDGKLGYLSCEIVVRKTKDVKIDDEKLNSMMERKWEETITELSSLVERPPQWTTGEQRRGTEEAGSSPGSRSP